MRKVLLSIVLVGFALVLFITLWPQTANMLLRDPREPDNHEISEGISIEPAPPFTVLQGESEIALYVRNNTNETVSFSLGHEHAHVSLRPQGDSIPPGGMREILLEAGAESPLGQTELPVYLRAEINGERVGDSVTVSFRVSPGELSLAYDRYGLSVLWNGAPAPRGAMIYYRNPGDVEWRIWGETPRTAPPSHLEAGEYTFEFIAELGETRSEIETFDVTVEEFIVRQDPEPEPEPQTPASEEKAEAPEPPPEPAEPPSPGTREYLVWLKQQQDQRKREAEEEEEEPSKWFQIEEKEELNGLFQN